jgi:hypothetical protein
VGKRWTWVAWSMLAVFVACLVVGLPLAVANGDFQHDAANQVLLVLGFSAFMAVGALVVAHRPGNAIGWLFSAIALLAVTGQLAGQYALYAYVTQPGSLPGGVLAAWYGSWPWWLVLALALVFTPLLFPTGRLLSRRWRPVAWLAGGATAVLTVLSSLRTELGTVGDQVIDNPIGVAAVENPEENTVGPALILLLGVLAAAFGSLALRFRRSRASSASSSSGSPTRDPAPPAVRHRPADQPYPGLRAVRQPASHPAAHRLLPAGQTLREALWRPRADPTRRLPGFQAYLRRMLHDPSLPSDQTAQRLRPLSRMADCGPAAPADGDHEAVDGGLPTRSQEG